MREIKFRAWDKKEKRFWSQDEMNSIGGFYYSYGVDPEPTEFDLMQFTGLRDKNGKEIYEGDVVSYPNYNYDPSEGDNPRELGEVKWGVGAFIVDNEPIANHDFEHEVEVIGNVHEQPELLTN